jgi:CRP-like cAMP-binding protein
MSSNISPLIKCINQISFFNEFTNADKEKLVGRSGIFKKYERIGYTLFSDGGKGESMFVILEGVINITRANLKGDKEKPFVLAKLKKGSVFGEISLLGNQKRTTCASTASSPVIVMEIDKKTIESFDLSMRELFYKQMILILIRRLDEMNNKLINTIG